MPGSAAGALIAWFRFRCALRWFAVSSLLDDQELAHRVAAVARAAKPGGGVGALGLGLVGDRPVRLSVEVVDDRDLELSGGQQVLRDAGEEQAFAGAGGGERVAVGFLELRERSGQRDGGLDFGQSALLESGPKVR
jgi:hypothetical protein